MSPLWSVPPSAEPPDTTFSGVCTNNGAPCTFTVDVTDNDEPGSTDSVTISALLPAITRDVKLSLWTLWPLTRLTSSRWPSTGRSAVFRCTMKPT